MIRNIKIVIISFLFMMISVSCFAVESAFVFTENLRIRNSPSSNGAVVGSISMKKVEIYDKQGTQKMINGVWDYWYKISEQNNQWINAYYVATFPILFRHGKDYKIENIDDDNMIDYYVFDFVNGEQVLTRKKDTALFDKLIDNPYMRLSELVKDINKQLHIEENTEYSYHNISALNLFYEIQKGMNIDYLQTITGNFQTGGHVTGIYEIFDFKKTYEIYVYINMDVGTIHHIEYTLNHIK